MFRRFEALLDPTEARPAPPPHAGLVRFYWHFNRQVRWLAIALFVVGGITALLDMAIPTCIGRLVGLVSTHPPGGLDEYYRKNVTGGPGSFVVVVEGFQTFAEAMINKLIREIAALP